MAITDWWIGDGGNDTTGDGLSFATRWLTWQKFIDTATVDQPNRCNVYGSETLGASADFTTRPMTLTITNFLIVQGTNGVVGDGGIGHFDGGTNPIVSNTAIDGLYFQNMRFTNWGTGYGFALDNSCGARHCEFDGENARAQCWDSDSFTVLENNKFHDFPMSGILINFASLNTFSNNYVQVNSLGSGDEVIFMSEENSVTDNIFSIDTTTNASVIRGTGRSNIIDNNSIYNQSDGTGNGIWMSHGNADYFRIRNNVVVGFNGTGGAGVRTASGCNAGYVVGNKYFRNDTNEDLPDDLFWGTDEETLGAMPFTSVDNANPDDDDFTLSSDIRGFPTEMYDPGDLQAGRNQTAENPGALQLVPPVCGGGLVDVDELLIPGNALIATNGNPSGEVTINAAGERFAALYYSGVPVPATDTLTKVHFRVDSVATSGDVDVTIETIDSNGEPSGTLLATGAENAAVTISAAGWVEVTLDTAPNITQTTRFAIVITSATASTLDAVFSGIGTDQGYPYPIEDVGSGWTDSNRQSLISYELGTGGIQNTGARLTGTLTSQFDEADTPNERGAKFSLPFACTISGANFQFLDADVDVDVIVYNSSSVALRTVSVDVNDPISSTSALAFGCRFAPLTFEADEVFYIGVKPATGAGVRVQEVTYVDTTEKALYLSYLNTVVTRKDTGAWTEDTLKAANMQLVVTQLADGVSTGGGGGGGLLRISMNGGIIG